jgi:3-oxoacyl-[acyl-carrier protein] reductase
MDLNNKYVLVTGASRGIGRAISKALAGKGAFLILSARTEDLLSEVKKEIITSGGRAEYIACDLARDEDILELFKKIKKDFGKLDILINNAGIAKGGSIVDFPVKDFDRLININLRAPYICCQQALKMMIPAGSGYIINISSVVGIKGYPYQTAYSASKHGITGLTKAIAAEVQENGIRVSMILPGGVDTALVGNTRPDLDKSILLKPEDIANTVLYLLSLPERAMVDQVYIRRSVSKPF